MYFSIIFFDKLLHFVIKKILMIFVSTNLRQDFYIASFIIEMAILSVVSAVLN